MSKRILFLVICMSVLVLLFSSNVYAHDYNKENSDHPGRYLSYLCHPFGVAAEYAIVRPFHYLVSLSGVNKIAGHESYKCDNFFGNGSITCEHLEMKQVQLAQAKKAEVTKKSDEIDELKKIIQDKEAEINSLGDDAASAKKEIEELKQALAQKEKELADLKASLNAKNQEIADLKKELEGKVQIQETKKTLSFTLLEGVLFASGSDQITSQGLELLSKVAKIIKEQYPDRELMVQGHTDTDPVKESSIWKSNWELGAARSIAVSKYFINNEGFDPAKITASTNSEFKPVADNSTEEGKAQNRRSIILILPKDTVIEKAEIK